jgi:hypothetical protein
MTTVQFDSMLTTALRGEGALHVDPCMEDALLRRIAFHGVGTLLLATVRAEDMSASLRTRLKNGWALRAVWEEKNRGVLAEALAALSAAGVQPLLLKGTCLAQTHYPDAISRPRADTDILVAPGYGDKAAQALELAGFSRDVAISGQFVSYQASFSRFVDGAEHVIDLHWRINNSAVLAALFTHADLLGRAVPLPALGPHARGTGPVDALLIACMHRATHRCNPYYVFDVAHYEADRLIWLYDIRLLSQSFDPDSWSTFVGSARDRQLRAICAEALETTVASLGTCVPAEILNALRQGTRDELPARYLVAGRIRQHWLDLLALGTFGNRMAFMRETLFPPQSFMQARHGASGRGSLPWHYLRRAIRGAMKAARIQQPDKNASNAGR